MSNPSLRLKELISFREELHNFSTSVKDGGKFSSVYSDIIEYCLEDIKEIIDYHLEDAQEQINDEANIEDEFVVNEDESNDNDDENEDNSDSYFGNNFEWGL